MSEPAVFTACDPPWHGTDLAHAEAATLRALGLPPRPEAGREPALHAHWRAMFLDAPLRFIAPQLERTLPLADHAPLRQPVHAGHARPGGLSRNWSGAVAGAHSGLRFRSVIGRWRVPELGAAPPPGQETLVSAWVGLGGARGSGHSMPQMGSEHGWHADGTPVHRLWVQWWQGNRGAGMLSTVIANLPVQPGDEVLCWLTMATPHEALCWVRRQRTGADDCGFGTLAGLRARSALPVAAGSAEWIVERPTQVLAPPWPADQDPDPATLRHGGVMRLPAVAPFEIGGALARLESADGRHGRTVGLGEAALLTACDLGRRPSRVVLPLQPELLERGGETVLRVVASPAA